MKTTTVIRHSPTPWRISGQSESGKYFIVKSECGRTVARVPFYTEIQRRRLEQPVGATFDRGDAKRIVACVNACDGFDPAAVADLIKELDLVHCPICNSKAYERQDNPCAACGSRRRALARARL